MNYLAGSLQLWDPEEELAEFGRDIRIVRERVLLKRLQHRFLRASHTFRLL